MTVNDFILEYFWSPGYNTINTLTYGIILAACVYGIMEAFKRKEFTLDRKFLVATLPFIFFGATARELVDRGFGLYPGYAPYPANFWVVAPGIYVTMFVLTSAVLIATLRVSRQWYHVPMAATGIVLSAYNMILIMENLGDLKGLYLAFLFFSLSALAAYVFFTYWGHSLLSQADSFRGNFGLVAAHLLDASATFVGVDFLGFTEKHVLPNYLIGFFGSSVVMFPLKVLVVGLAVYVIDREYGGDDLARGFIKFVVLVLGLGPAIRDLALIALM
ncbi:MAG: DUF63 family protein [Candidatus Altiarchaeota archaeon]